MYNLLALVKNAYPAFSFEPHATFHWSPQKKAVHYVEADLETPRGSWSLLHEVGHGQLGHETYETDIELLHMELEAWGKAQQSAKQFGITIPENHIQDCLETYREWLYARSSCPYCTNAGLQIETNVYSCYNCNNTWRVSRSRHCRIYRKKQSKT